MKLKIYRLIENRLPEQKLSKGQNVDVYSVSQPIAKPHVVSSLFCQTKHFMDYLFVAFLCINCIFLGYIVGLGVGRNDANNSRN